MQLCTCPLAEALAVTNHVRSTYTRSTMYDVRILNSYSYGTSHVAAPSRAEVGRLPSPIRALYASEQVPWRRYLPVRPARHAWLDLTDA